MNVALLGAGWFGREAHLRNLVALGGVDVIAASSRSEASLDAAKAIVGDQLQTFTDWKEVLKIESVDAVVIALTNNFHHEAALAAYAAGKHVMLEKPLGLSIAECDDIIAASEAAGKVLQIGHEMRFQRLYSKMKGMIDGGEIGDLQLMWCREFRGPMRPGWRSSEALTGGTILEKNCHHIDLFNWMIDRKPLRVGATGGTNVLKDREILDNAQVLIEYEGGRRATLELCLFAPFGGECEIGVAGDLGRIDTKNQALELVHHRFDLPDKNEMQIADIKEDAGFVDSSGRVDRGIRPELEHWIDCCRENKSPLTDGYSAKMSVAVCLAAQESIKRGEFVMIDELLG
ncbi:MAG: Gfo/Idh/MocA family protein [Verrucomicrobiales bacterium]